MPLLGDPAHTGLTKFLKSAPQRVPAKPKALLVVSAHWEVSECVLSCICHTPSSCTIVYSMWCCGAGWVGSASLNLWGAQCHTLRDSVI